MATVVTGRPLFEVPEERIDRRRRMRVRQMWIGAAGAVLAGIFAMYEGLLARPSIVDPEPGRVAATAAGIAVIFAVIVAAYAIPNVRRINRIAVYEDRVFPPDKPRLHRIGADWCFNLADVRSARARGPAAGRGPTEFQFDLSDGVSIVTSELDLIGLSEDDELSSYSAALSRFLQRWQASGGR